MTDDRYFFPNGFKLDPYESAENLEDWIRKVEEWSKRTSKPKTQFCFVCGPFFCRCPKLGTSQVIGWVDIHNPTVIC